MGFNHPSRVRAGALLIAATIAASLIVGTSPAIADTAPVDTTVPETVSTDLLPTVQINGVVWSQTIVGNVVYAGGNFSTAQPAGAAAGVNTVPRSNLLAYDIRTGELITSFAPVLNGQVRVVTASPDGSVLYVGGEFTTVDGQSRSRIAAFNTATGALISVVPSGRQHPGVRHRSDRFRRLHGRLVQRCQQHAAQLRRSGERQFWRPAAVRAGHLRWERLLDRRLA